MLPESLNSIIVYVTVIVRKAIRGHNTTGGPYHFGFPWVPFAYAMSTKVYAPDFVFEAFWVKARVLVRSSYITQPKT